MLRCSIALWQDCSCGRKWNKNCSLPEQVEKYLIVDHFLIVPPFRVDFANEDSLIRSSSDDECFDSYSWDLLSLQKLWEFDGDRVWSQHHKDKDYPEEVVKNYWADYTASRVMTTFSQPGTWICRWMGNWRDFLQVIIAKDCFPTGQGQACTRINRFFVCLFVRHHAKKWPNTQKKWLQSAP